MSEFSRLTFVRIIIFGQEFYEFAASEITVNYDVNLCSITGILFFGKGFRKWPLTFVL